MHLKKLHSIRNWARKMKELTHSRERNHYKALNPDSPQQFQHLERKTGSRSPPRGVPEGYLAVYVGEERRRFVVPMVYLSHPIFLMLLDKAHEEYGFKQKEGLMVPCDVHVFEQLLWLIRGSQSASGQFELEKLVSNFMAKGSSVPDE